MSEQVREAKEMFENAKNYYESLKERRASSSMIRDAEKAMIDAAIHLEDMRTDAGEKTLD